MKEPGEKKYTTIVELGPTEILHRHARALYQGERQIDGRFTSHFRAVGIVGVLIVADGPGSPERPQGVGGTLFHPSSPELARELARKMREIADDLESDLTAPEALQ